MMAQGIPDFFIRRSLGVVGQAPPPIPKFLGDAAGAVRLAGGFLLLMSASKCRHERDH
jgi:hypothetical protein